jgi:outer membrane biosynthesis protein TonB
MSKEVLRSYKLKYFYYFASIAFHLLILFICTYTFLSHKAEVTTPQEEEIISINLIANETPPAPEAIPSPPEIEKPLETPKEEKAEVAIKEVIEKPIQKEVKKAEAPILKKKINAPANTPLPYNVQQKGKTPPKFNYEAMLAAHILQFANMSQNKSGIAGKVEIWVKLTREGTLLAWGVLNTKDTRILQYVKSIVDLAQPLPKPPEEQMTSSYIIYKLSLFLI